MKKTVLLLIAFLFVSSGILLADGDTALTKYWIIFTDKDGITQNDKIEFGSDEYNLAKEQLSEPALKRRMKVLSKENLVGFADLPVSTSYIEDISDMKIEIIAKSKWFNGVSAYLTPAQLQAVKKIDFVAKIFAVKKLYKQDYESISPVFINREYGILYPQDSGYTYDYGNSFNQMMLVNVPVVHDLGITGNGVLVASFDDGFEWKTHESLMGLNVLSEFDFINKDKNTAREKEQKHKDTESQGGHGTATLSSLAGFKEGKLIGPAFNSDFILAKTEYVATETPMEEDFWLEAAEWAEAYGADVITSSLVYKAFDKPFMDNSYTYADFDGKTSIITIAGDLAAHYGVVVCNATGNYNQTTPPSLGSAADGDSVIGVGAVDKKGTITSFSSNGPTSDGRIKPDVVAPGASVYVARMGDGNKYDYSNGTSFSTPITAGVCALILSAHPQLTAMQVREALRNTANNSASPDNTYGWGLINAYKAILYFGPAWGKELLSSNGNSLKIKIGFAANDFTQESPVMFYYKDSKSKKYNSIELKLSKQLEKGNFSGIYEAETSGITNLKSLDYYFSVNLNGKEIKKQK